MACPDCRASEGQQAPDLPQAVQDPEEGGSPSGSGRIQGTSFCPKHSIGRREGEGKQESSGQVFAARLPEGFGLQSTTWSLIVFSYIEVLNRLVAFAGEGCTLFSTHLHVPQLGPRSAAPSSFTPHMFMVPLFV